MRKRKGLSMVEVILSLVLLGAVSLILVTGIKSAYSNLMKMKMLTTDSYAMMQAVENSVQNIKKELKKESPDLTDYTVLTYNAFGKRINVYETSVTGEFGSIWTVAGENTYKELPTPGISVSAILENGNFAAASYLNSNLFVNSKEVRSDNNSSLYMMTTYRWYVSKKGFYIRSNDESDYLNSSYYPVFPSDYTAVGGAEGSTSGIKLNSDEYLGRHVLVVATPVAVSGKMGTRSVSNPVYISGLPVTGSSLKVHLDASLIGIDDYEAYLSGTGTVQKWTDFSKNGYDAVAVPTGSSVENRTTEFGESYANVLGFKDGVTMKTESALDAMSEFTLFAVVHSGEGSISNSFISADNWNLAIKQFKLGEEQLEINNTADGNWHVLGITVSKKEGAGKISVTVDDAAVQEMPLGDAGMQINSGKLQIGADGIKLAEIIIYNEALESGMYGDVQKYLLEKYDDS